MNTLRKVGAPPCGPVWQSKPHIQLFIGQWQSFWTSMPNTREAFLAWRSADRFCRRLNEQQGRVPMLLRRQAE